MINPTQTELPAPESVRVWQQRLVRSVLRTMVLVAPVVIGVSCYFHVLRGIYWTAPVYAAMYAVIVLFAFWKEAPYRLQVATIIGIFGLLAVMDFTLEGPTGSARPFLLMMPFSAGLFLGRRPAVGALIVALLAIAGLYSLMTAGLISVSSPVSPASVAGWLPNVVALMLVGIYVVTCLGYVLPRLISALDESRILAGELQQQQSSLEVQVAERTADLTRRSGQLAAAAEVAREAAAIQDVERVLAETSQLISRQFGFYHTGIFMLDPARQYAVLRAASSEGGRRMMARSHRLRVGREGIVGQVMATGEAHIALDVGTDAIFFDNPDLPETRSEIALPLRARGEIIGALDVQSREPGAFGPENVSELQILADQVALAISNARLLEQLERSLEAERRAYGAVSRKAWQDQSKQGRLERRFDPDRILAGSEGWREEMTRAVTTAEPAAGRDPRWPSVAIPVKVRGEVIGVLDAFKPASAQQDQDVWAQEEVMLLETLADQLGAALDGARLYQETQRRANQERLAAEVTARMRETLDVDTVLRTAAQEIRQAMGLAAMTIRLTPAGFDGPGSPGGSGPGGRDDGTRNVELEEERTE